jgi:hypothetical protein
LCSSSQIHSSFTYVEVQNKQNKRYLEPPPSSSTNNSSQSNPLTSHLILAAAVDLLGVRPTHVPVVSPPVAVEGLRGGALTSHGVGKNHGKTQIVRRPDQSSWRMFCQTQPTNAIVYQHFRPTQPRIAL